MLQETTELFDNFVAVALRHRLVSQHDAERILKHAERDAIQQSDAALSLSLMSPQKVDAVQLLQQPSSLAPGFVLTDLVGCGAAGIVLRARQTALDRDVAIKTISLNSQPNHTSSSRIQREAHAIARLNHPNIVAVYDSGFHQGRFYIAMELVDGADLSDFIRRSGPMPEGTTWMIARQVASALAHASEAGVVHRDIKPANILITKSTMGMSSQPGTPLVKVADFGLAFYLADSAEANLTATSATLGTPAYIAPEQLLNSHVDSRADIYSLGATVYHMLTGSAPYTDQSPMKVIIGKTTGDNTWREDLPSGLTPNTVKLFREMTEENVQDRVGDYAELIRRIDAVFADGNSNQSGLSDSPRIQRTGTKRRVITRSLAWLVSLTVIAATLALAAIFLTAGFRTPADSSENTSREWKVSGLPEPVFNGQSVPLLPQKGSWSPDSALDGGRVLVGAENAQMTFPLTTKSASTANVRFRLRVQPQGPAIAEIAFPEPPRRQGVRRKVALRIGKERAELVYADRVGQELDTVAGSEAINLRSGSQEDVVFQDCQVSRLQNRIRVSVNGSFLGSIECDPNNASTATIRAIGGTVHFADIDIVEIVEKSPAE